MRPPRRDQRPIRARHRVYVDDAGPAWLVECRGCREIVLAGTTRQGALAAADRHNDETHDGSFVVDDAAGELPDG